MATQKKYSQESQQNSMMPSTGSYNNNLQRASLYVGDLDPGVTNADLVSKFSAVVPIISAHLCRCAITGESLCYGYVNFISQFYASKALLRLNHTDFKGKPMRIMWSHRDPFPRKTGIGNLFVKNLDHSINSAILEGMFCPFGNVISCRVVEENGKSKGFGFVQFDSEESSMAAQSALHDTVVEGKKIYVSKFVKKNERKATYEEKFTNLYVKNLDAKVTEDLLLEKFSAYGKVRSVAIMKDSKGKSRAFGFVSFESPEEAKKAVQVLNGEALESKTLFVGRAQKKEERIEILKQTYKEAFNFHFANASNLYVKNLRETIDDVELQKLFNQYGNVKSAKVMHYDDGKSKGFGFVCFSTPYEASLALKGLHGAIYSGKTLYVAIAKSKEDRHKQLQMQMNNVQSSMLYSNSSTYNAGRTQQWPYNLKYTGQIYPHPVYFPDPRIHHNHAAYWDGYPTMCYKYNHPSNIRTNVQMRSTPTIRKEYPQRNYDGYGTTRFRITNQHYDGKGKASQVVEKGKKNAEEDSGIDLSQSSDYLLEVLTRGIKH